MQTLYYIWRRPYDQEQVRLQRTAHCRQGWQGRDLRVTGECWRGACHQGQLRVQSCVLGQIEQSSSSTQVSRRTPQGY